jgi:hypothetical protein
MRRASNRPGEFTAPFEKSPNLPPIQPPRVHAQRHPAVLAGIRSQKEARVFEEQVEHQLSNFDRDAQFAFILLQRGEGSAGDLKRGMTKRDSFSHARYPPADLSQTLENGFPGLDETPLGIGWPIFRASLSRR